MGDNVHSLSAVAELFVYGVLQIELPKSEHVAGDLCSFIGEMVLTHRSPLAVVKNFKTSVVRNRTSRQSH